MDNKQNTNNGFKEKIRINLTMSTRPVGEEGFETLTNGEMQCQCTTMEYAAFIKDLILGYTKNDRNRTLDFLKLLAMSTADEFMKPHLKKDDKVDITEADIPTYSEREDTSCNCEDCKSKNIEEFEDEDGIEMKVIHVKDKEQAKKLLNVLMGMEKESK